MGKAQKISKKELQKILRNFIRSKGESYLDGTNITSIGIGYKIKDGKKTDEITLQFTVSEKAAPDQLESLGTELIPKTIEVEGMEIPTDVIERKYELSYTVLEDININERKIRVNPICPGVSISNIKGTAGTLGCIVYDALNEKPYVLSNWHVLHGNSGLQGDIIVQPGPHDDSRASQNHCGSLVRSYLGIAGDCAVADISNRDFKEEIKDLGINVKSIAEPELDDIVIKSGRTTNVTYGKVERTDVIISINYGQPTGSKRIGCFEIGIDPANPPSNGEISSPGDSGSVWMIVKSGKKASDIMAGLHFAGESSNDPHEHALACYPASVFEKLGIKPSKSNQPTSVKTTGYNAHFLGEEIPAPTLDDDNDAFKLEGGIVIDYTHFSLTLHKRRKFAIWVAWNIDGNTIKKISRSALKFKTDPRIPSANQIGDHLYSNNNLDRGHIARRADLLWGDIKEAQNANKDSFFFTNIVPQINNFNQSGLGGIWGGLEDAVFNEVDVENLKISLIGGPVFNDDDKSYRGIKVPREFYKILFYKVEGQLKVKAFLLTQNLNRIEVLDLEEFKVYEISLDELEERCHFKFKPELKSSTRESALESIQERKPIIRIDEVNW
jgi:endonuclease G